MKVKVKKYRGLFELVCDDSEINKKHDCTQEHPITLALLETWEASHCWKLKDMRLDNICFPRRHLEGSNLQKYNPVDKDDADNLKSKLKYFKEDSDGQVIWGTFAGIVALGDKTDHLDNPSWVNKTMEGCWSFKEARTKFKEIADFWRDFEGDDFSKAMMVNPYKQIDTFEYRLEKGDSKDSPKVQKKM